MPTGGCFCGAVRNAAKGELLFRVLCYCRGCQTASGTGHVPIAAAERRLERQIPGSRRTIFAAEAGFALCGLPCKLQPIVTDFPVTNWHSGRFWLGHRYSVRSLPGRSCHPANR
jgi:hypothetical protein